VVHQTDHIQNTAEHNVTVYTKTDTEDTYRRLL